MHIGSDNSHGPIILHVGERVFSAYGGDAKVVVPGVKERNERSPRCGRPFQRIDQTQREVYREALRSAQIAFEGIALAAKRMHVAGRGPLRARLFEKVGVARIQAVQRRALVSRQKWRDQMVVETDV